MLFSIGTLVARLILDEIGCSIFAGNFLMTPSPHFILGFADVRDPPVTSDVLYGGGDEGVRAGLVAFRMSARIGNCTTSTDNTEGLFIGHWWLPRCSGLAGSPRQSLSSLSSLSSSC